MQVVFRADATTQIGAGHIARCSVLAKALEAAGAEVVFVTPAESQPVLHLFVPEVRVLQIAGSIDESTDAQQVQEVLQQNGVQPDWLIVDHYALGEGWERAMRPYTRNIMVIDDLARIHDCDIVLDQNYVANFERRYAGCVPAHCTMLLGPSYALLRPAFAEYRRALQRSYARVQRGFICFGGSDPQDMTGRTVEALAQSALADCAVDIVVGPSYPHLAALQKQLEGFQRWQLHHGISDPERLMAQADIAIGAGGTMNWERCALGLPSLVISTADNQVAGCWQLAKQGIIGYLGEATGIKPTVILEAIERLRESPVMLRQYAKRSAALVDCLGLERAVRVIRMGLP